MSLSRESYRTRAAKLAAAASALKRAGGAGAKGAPFSLAFLSDAARAAKPELVARALPEGTAFIFRDYATPRRMATARRLLAICRERGLLFLLAGDPALAQDISADGAHLPSRLLHASSARTPRDGVILSAACHSREELQQAAAIGADLALLSPVFATASHPGAPALGAARFRALAASAPLPVLALGGINESNARRLTGAGVAGLAAIGAFLP